MISSGCASSVSLRAETVPDTGAYKSETLLVDSTSPKAAPAAKGARHQAASGPPVPPVRIAS